jgi:hypothetical protein
MDGYLKTAATTAKQRHFMDVEVINTNEGPGSAYIIDTTITGPSATSHNLRSAAGEAEKDKVDHYLGHYYIDEPDKRLIPWAVEAPGGAWGDRALKFARYIASQQHIHGGHIKPKAFFRMIVVRVAVALQHENAEAVRRLKQLIQAPPPQRKTKRR